MTTAPEQVIADISLGPEFWICSAWMVAGVIGHFITKLSAMEAEGQQPRPGHYLRTHPFRILNMLVTCEISLFLFHEMGYLNPVVAILSGYACQSVSDNLRKRAENRVKAIPGADEAPKP